MPHPSDLSSTRGTNLPSLRRRTKSRDEFLQSVWRPAGSRAGKLYLDCCRRRSRRSRKRECASAWNIVHRVELAACSAFGQHRWIRYGCRLDASRLQHLFPIMDAWRRMARSHTLSSPFAAAATLIYSRRKGGRARRSAGILVLRLFYFGISDYRHGSAASGRADSRHASRRARPGCSLKSRRTRAGPGAMDADSRRSRLDRGIEHVSVPCGFPAAINGRRYLRCDLGSPQVAVGAHARQEHGRGAARCIFAGSIRVSGALDANDVRNVLSSNSFQR